jgi:hypothetical protein
LKVYDLCTVLRDLHHKAIQFKEVLRRENQGLKVYRKRPKFGNGPLVRHPLSKLLKNHISAMTGVRDLAQFFWTNKKLNNWG